MFERYSFISEFGCLDRARIPNEVQICRLFKSETISEDDFRDEVDSGLKQVTMNNVCGYYSLSVNIYNEESKQKVLKKYQKMRSTAPQRGDFVHVFTVSEAACAIVMTENKSDRWHCSLFKSDNFSIEEINVTETIRL